MVNVVTCEGCELHRGRLRFRLRELEARLRVLEERANLPPPKNLSSGPVGEHVIYDKDGLWYYTCPECGTFGGYPDRSTVERLMTEHIKWHVRCASTAGDIIDKRQ